MRSINQLELSGKRFGKWTVLFRDRVNSRGEVFWRCRCDCGVKKSIRAGNLRSGGSISCGCHRIDAITTHGMTDTPAFRSWSSMKQRCLNPNAPDYERYGGRGIKICASWVNSFENFLSDMGMRPTGKTLDRKDVNGNYEPDNCLWSTSYEQHLNRRNTRYVSYKGKKRVLATLAEEFGIKPAILVSRLGSGWSIERALTEPIMQGRGRKGPRKD